MSKEDYMEFMKGSRDFGLVDLPEPLPEDQRKLAAFVMAVQATLVQLILEGVFNPAEQIHFMSHLQDFTARLYSGEGVKLEGVKQTLKVNSEAGKLFLSATEDAFINGHENFLEIKRISKQIVEEAEQNKEQENVSTKPTLH